MSYSVGNLQLSLHCFLNLDAAEKKLLCVLYFAIRMHTYLRILLHAQLALVRCS